MQPDPKPAPSTPQKAGTSFRLPGELALWFERALGAAPQMCADRDRPLGALAARDAVLRALAQRFYPCCPVSTQAVRIHALAEAYAFANRAGNGACLQLPERFRGTPEEYLWAAFNLGAPMALGPRDLRRILIGAPHSEG